MASNFCPQKGPATFKLCNQTLTLVSLHTCMLRLDSKMQNHIYTCGLKCKNKNDIFIIKIPLVIHTYNREIIHPTSLGNFFSSSFGKYYLYKHSSYALEQAFPKSVLEGHCSTGFQCFPVEFCSSANACQSLISENQL